MHLIDGPGAAPGGLFTEGDPTAGTPATVVTAAWLNTIQGELASVAQASGAALAKTDNGQVLAALRWLLAQAVPPGTIIHYGGIAAPPAGYLKCNGDEVSRTAYAALFAAIGTTYGAGNGATTFRVPELRAEFLRGLDDGRGVDMGRALGTAQASQNKEHDHGTGIHENGVGGLKRDTTWSFDSNVGELRTTLEGGSEARSRNVAVWLLIKT